MSYINPYPNWLPNFPTYTPITSPNVGWICPECGKVHAPFILYCDCYLKKKEEII